MRKILGKFLYNKPVARSVNRYYDGKCKNLKNVIFVATTGRSGTLTLVDIFNRLDNCTALHEPYPNMNDKVLHAAAAGELKLVKEYYDIRKSVNIRRSAAGYEHYLEANHLFIKTFIEYAAIDFKDKIKIIHLVRSPTKVANSIYTLQDQPGTKTGNQWWLDYRAPTNIISIANELDYDAEFEHPYYKALWYWFEIEARVAHWKKQLPEVPFLFFRTEDFNSKAGLEKLFENLGMSTPQGFFEQVANVKKNTRTHRKKIPPLEQEQADEMLARFKALLVNKKYALPITLNEYYSPVTGNL